MDPLRPLREDLAAPSRWPVFEGLRGVASVAVVGYHVLRLLADERAWAEALPRALWWTAGGRLGVDVFFVLSGFLVTMSWTSARRRATSAGAAARTYAAKRLLRILPAYWLSLAVFLPTVAPTLLAWDHARDLVLLVTGQGYWEPGLVDQVNTVYWTLTTELDFYLVVPLVALALARRLGWPLLALTLVTSTLWVHGDLAGLRGDLPASHLGGRLDQFVAGAVAGMLVLRHEDGHASRLARALGAPGVGWGLAAALLALSQLHGATLFQGGSDRWTIAAFHPAFGLVVAATVVRVALRPPRWLLHPLARAPGQVSYSLYLWHYPLLVWALTWSDLDHAGYAIGVRGVGVLAAALVVIAAASYSSYLVAERWLVRRRHQPAPTA